MGSLSKQLILGLNFLAYKMRKLNYAHHLRKCFEDLRPSQTQRAVVAVCGGRKVGRVSSSREEGKMEASQSSVLVQVFQGSET